jgi:hypothetical protein
MTHKDVNSTESFEVLNSDTFASSWLSVAVLDNNLTALCIDTVTASAAIGFFRLVKSSPTELALQECGTSVSLNAYWNVHMHEWLDYSRVVVSAQTENILVASVELQTSDELRATSLMLRVCVCTQNKNSVCSEIVLSEMSVSSTANFISAAYIQQEQVNRRLHCTAALPLCCEGFDLHRKFQPFNPEFLINSNIMFVFPITVYSANDAIVETSPNLDH